MEHRSRASRLVRMLWQTWHRELGGGERLGSGRGCWPWWSQWAGAPREWGSWPALGTGGGDGTGRAGVGAAAGDLGELQSGSPGGPGGAARAPRVGFAPCSRPSGIQRGA